MRDEEGAGMDVKPNSSRKRIDILNRFLKSFEWKYKWIDLYLCSTITAQVRVVDRLSL